MIVPACPDTLVASVPLPCRNDQVCVVFGAAPEYLQHPLHAADNAVFASAMQPALFRDQSVDVILCLDAGDQPVVDGEELQRILKPEGTLAVLSCGVDERHAVAGPLNRLAKAGDLPLFPPHPAGVDALFERSAFEHAGTGRLPFLYTVRTETFWMAVRSHFARSIADSALRKRVLQRAMRIVRGPLRVGSEGGFKATLTLPCFLDYYLFRPRPVHMLG